MSEYMRIKQQIEELTAQLETVRRQEVDVEVMDIRKRIVAFGITPEQLFPDMSYKERRNRGVKSTKPAMYKWNGHTWHGQGGPQPKWFKDALAVGVTAEQMLIKPGEEAPSVTIPKPRPPNATRASPS